jgi:hypothetical protein
MSNQNSTPMTTRVLECVCKHAFQDERYGKNMRLHNPKNHNPKKDKDGNKWRCTVCGKTR